MARLQRVDLAQIGVDVLLSLAAIIALDSQSTPLAWILLFVPVLDAAVRYGLRGAVSVWVSVSLIYVSILLSLRVPTPATPIRCGPGSNRWLPCSPWRFQRSWLLLACVAISMPPAKRGRRPTTTSIACAP
ncbi:MAG: hypothetical protein R2706_07975 [Acidimicrobiales bacterium]